MKIDPNKRGGKGQFPDETGSTEPDSNLIDDTLRRAETRTVLFDYLHMVFVGFWSTLRGLFVVEGKTGKTGGDE